MEKHLFNKTILREYDIRGLVGKNLTETVTSSDTIAKTISVVFLN